MNTFDIKKMTFQERLHTMELLWESLCQDESELASPEWHEPVLKERMQKLKKNQTGIMTLQQVKKTLSR